MVEIDEKIKKLEEELVKLEEKSAHMASEYAETKAGSAYGVEYYEIQVKVYQSMIASIKKEILDLKHKKLI
ncbi:MAG: hypothetical protein WAV41_02845 [Microgenomates group bacterium]